jgi:signal transduction histidine kinase
MGVWQSRDTGGMGLGLSIAEWIVHATVGELRPIVS